jgi:hypothetical protein
MKNLLISTIFYLIAHALVWFQMNGQFMWRSWKGNILLVSLIGIPASIFFIWATKWGVKGFDGLLWPNRFVSFAIGIFVYGFFVNYFFNEAINLKTIITLILALMILLVQIFWK